MQCVYLFTPQEAKIVGNSRQSSSVVNFLGSFFKRPINVSLLCGFSSCLRMINLKNPCLFASLGPTNYGKATYIVSSNLCLLTFPQATGFPWNRYSERHISAKRVFLKFIPVILMLTFQIIYQYPMCESI